MSTNKNQQVNLLINDEEILNYDRSIELPEAQQDYLTLMDNKMSSGITLSNVPVINPDLMQKTQFVALNMLDYIQQDNFNQAIALFTYIVNAHPDLLQVKTKGAKGNYRIEFIFDEENVEQLTNAKVDSSNQWQEVKFT